MTSDPQTNKSGRPPLIVHHTLVERRWMAARSDCLSNLPSHRLGSSILVIKPTCNSENKNVS